MKRSLPLILAAIFLIAGNSVEARHSGNASMAFGGRAATSAAPAGNAQGAGSPDHGGSAQFHASGTPTSAFGAKNFGAHVPPLARAQGRGSASSIQLAMLQKATRADAARIAVAPSQMPTGHATQMSRTAVPLSPTRQALSTRTLNGFNQPAPGPQQHHRFSSIVCGPWCYNRGLGYGMNPYETQGDCEKWKHYPEAYQKCLARKARYSPVLPADGSRA